MKYIRFSDFKGRWSLNTKLDEKNISDFFHFFRDALLEIEDQGFIKNYEIQYLNKGILYRRISINISDNSNDKIKIFIDSIKEKTSLLGELKGNISISVNIILPNTDLTEIMSLILNRVNFIKDNGKENNFECIFISSTTNLNYYRIILNYSL
jgi:hypothetical protein